MYLKAVSLVEGVMVAMSKLPSRRLEKTHTDKYSDTARDVPIKQHPCSEGLTNLTQHYSILYC